METKRILIIRSGAVGDIIMTTPFLRNLREFFPNSKISFFVGKWSKKVLTRNSNIDEIIEFDDEVIIKKTIFRVISLIKKLRRKRFDMCFILDKSWMWNLFAFLCGIKIRIGFARGREGIWNTKSIKYDGSKNEVDYYLDLLSLLCMKTKNCPTQIFTTKYDKVFANKFMKKIGNEKKLIGICPGGAVNPGQKAIIKRWPVEKYIELVDKKNFNYVIFGDKNDKKVAKEIIEKSKNKKIYDMTGISIQETKEVMEKCHTIISHDSGALHIASATSSKIIALFGPTPSNRFSPKGAVVIKAKCDPCYTVYGKFEKCQEDCMSSIKVEELNI